MEQKWSRKHSDAAALNLDAIRLAEHGGSHAHHYNKRNASIN